MSCCVNLLDYFCKQYMFRKYIENIFSKQQFTNINIILQKEMPI